MNKQDLINKIKQVEGLTHDERSELINLLNTKKKYGLVWEDKPEAVEEEMRTQLPVLKEVVEKRILSESVKLSKSEFTELRNKQSDTSKPKEAGLFDNVENEPINQDSLLPDEEINNTLLLNTTSPNHILIEGDNLHALTALTFTHEGKIDVIYIDPPYNTGNKDFKYNDSFVDKEDSYRHSKWLSFMHKRLEIAKRLLSDKGVIFISIDDNEQAQLKMLCDEVFGEINFISSIIWQKKTGASDAKTIDTITEYILALTKSPQFQTEIFKRNIESYDLNRYKYKDEYFEVRGPYYLDTLDRGGLRYSDSLNYPIECPDGTLCYPNGRTKFINDGWTFKWGKEKVKWGLENKFIDFRKAEKKGSGWTVCYKNYLYVDNEGTPIERSAPLKNMIVDIKNADGAANIKDIFSHQLFKYSKPVKLIFRVLNYIQHKNVIILDFFAGSGTTLHATMQLNAEDGGNRQCILVTNNENNICENVTYERNKRVIEGYTNAKGVWVEGLTGNNLRYYKTEFVASTKNEPNKRLMAQCSTDLLCIKEDCFTELTESLNFNPVQCKIFTNDKGKYLMVVYHSRKQWEVNEKLINYIKTLDDLSETIRLYAFIPEKETLLEDFAEVADKIEAVPLPEAIYNAYRATFRTLKLDKKAPVVNIADSEDFENENELIVITQDEE